MDDQEKKNMAIEIANRIISMRPKDEINLKVWLRNRVGLSYLTFRGWQKGFAYPSDENLRKICQRMKISRGWLEYGKGPQQITATITKELFDAVKDIIPLDSIFRLLPNDEDPPRSPEEIAATMIEEYSREVAVRKGLDARTARKGFYVPAVGEFVLLPNAEMPPGAQMELETPNQVAPYIFREDWLNRIATAPGNCVLFKVSDDGMLPTLQCGDMVLIDTGRKNIVSGHLYAIYLKHEGRTLKRLELTSNGDIVINSDNRKVFPTKKCPSRDVSILGEVLWLARTLEKPSSITNKPSQSVSERK